jgi:hypothetical protein
MRRWCKRTILAASISIAICGCGGDSDDVAEVKTALPMDQVPAAVLKAAREKDPSLTFYAAYRGKFEGKDSIELKGKTKTGKIKEVEVSPDGQVLGVE